VQTKAPGRTSATISAALVDVVEVGEEEADGDRLDALVAQVLGGDADGVLVERREDRAGRWQQPLRHGAAELALDQRPRLPGDVLLDRVVVGALVAADVDDVAEALGGDHPRLRALVLEDRVGRDRGAVHHQVDFGGADAAGGAEVADAAGDRRGDVLAAADLHHLDPVGVVVEVDEVGEGAADVDPDRLHAAGG
jgi:hypothetical protein